MRGDIPRRQILRLVAGGAALSALPRVAAAAPDYPARPVHMIVDIPAGLAPDVIARMAATPLSAQLHQQFLVENRPGAGGNVGAEYVIRAAPDGYTLLVMISGNAASAALYPNLDFNFIRDIAPVAFMGYTPFVVVVSPSVPRRRSRNSSPTPKPIQASSTSPHPAPAPRRILPSNCFG